MAYGLYRRLKRGKTGRWKETGAYVIDMRIKRVPELAGIKARLFKTTGVSPGQRDAPRIVREMKLMIKELIQKRDADTLRRIQKNQLSLPSAHKRWVQGRLHLAEQHEDQPALKLWRRYYDTSIQSARTKENRHAILDSLVAKDLLTEKQVVNELPEILAKIQRYYAARKRHAAFNTIRIETRAFVTKGLGIEAGSPFVQAILRVRPLKELKPREHHPFYSPRDCAKFCGQLLSQSTPNAPLYAESVLFMCMHGLRPEEFAFRKFAIDEDTDHLRVRGTKNPNANRVVPLSFRFERDNTPRVDTLNIAFERMGYKTRCRDFRRTFAIWCEAAGIPNSRLQAYMGHAAQSVTETYQSTVPKQVMLDADRKLLQKWYRAELDKEPAKRDEGPVMSSFRALMQLRKPSLEKTRKQLLAERAAIAAHNAKHPFDRE